MPSFNFTPSLFIKEQQSWNLSIVTLLFLYHAQHWCSLCVFVQHVIQRGPGLPLGLKCNANKHTQTVCTASVKTASLPLVKINYSEAYREKPAPTISIWIFTPHSLLWQWSALIRVMCTVKGEYTHQCLMYCSRLYSGYRSLMRT